MLIYHTLMLLFILLIPKAKGESKRNSTYGPYTVEWTKFDTCSVAKDAEKSARVSVTRINPEHQVDDKPADPIFRINITIITPLTAEEIRMSVYYYMKENRRDLVWHKTVTKPCTSYYFQLFGVMPSACKLKKGSYVLDLNFTDITRKLFGNEFNYGKYYVRALGISNGKTLGCVIIASEFKKAENKLKF